MKKQTQRTKKKKTSKSKNPAAQKNRLSVSKETSSEKKPTQQKPVRTSPAKAVEKKHSGNRAFGKYISKAGQFLREAKMELKKVKWPTRKELLASTAVVIVLTLIVALFLGLVDFGLIKIIKNIVG
jgi:preprotein translocase subunit SecE